MPRLEVIDLRKEYEGKPLLNGVTFQVQSGETLSLLGASGSGKSTILRIIAGIETPDAGSVLWNDQDLAGIPVYRRNFGLMFQDYALFPHLSVEENVTFGLKMKKLLPTDAGKITREMLDRVNMTGFEARRVTDLSGGEQQRIALARALAPQPGLLMLDEPLAALDRSTRLELQEELRRVLQQAGIPVLYVTHDQEEAIVVSDRLALLNDGKIVQCDRTEEVFRYPRNRWVAEFLGMSNFLTGVVLSADPLLVRTACGDLHASVGKTSALPVPGSIVSILVKPTGTGLGGTEKSVNLLHGKLRSASFRGDHYRLHLEVSPGKLLEFSSTRSGEVDEMITLELSTEDVVCLEE